MLYLLLGVFIFCLALACGRKALQVIKVSCEKDEEIVFGTGLGLGLLSYAVLLLGVLGVLQPPFLWGLLFFLLVLAGRNIEDSFQVLKGGFGAWKIPLTKVNLLILSLSFATLIAILAGTLAPETANDSLCYHLHLPKLFLEQGSVTPPPYEVNALFPFLMEMLYTLALGLNFSHDQPLWGGMILAKFFHLGTGLLAMGAILIFLKRHTRTEFAWYGALLFGTTPVVVNQLATTYVDVGGACFSMLALFSILRWVDSRQRGWIVLAGIFSGFTLSVKYLGLISVSAISLVILGQFFCKGNLAKTVKDSAFFVGAMILFCGYWYLRSYLELGNPVYPYFYSVFKSGYAHIHYSDIGVSKDWLSFLGLPWTITMHPEKFEGFGVQIGPGYLAFLPMAFLYGFRKTPHGKSLLFFAAFYFVSWFFLGQSLRFFIPVLPVLSVLIAVGLAVMERPDGISRSMSWLFVFVFLIHTVLALFHYRGSFKVASGGESQEEYLSRVERSYLVAKYVNSHLSEKVKILNCDDPRMFYFRRSIVREGIYADRTGYFKKADSPPEILKHLIGQGFTHILWAERIRSVDSPPLNLEPLRIPRLLAENEKGLASLFEEIYTQQVTTPEEEKITYHLYSIKI